MSSNSHIVDIIERAHDARPFCPCGSHTLAVWRDGMVRIECASLSEPADSRVGRVIRRLTSVIHVSEPIVEVPAADEPVPAAA